METSSVRKVRLSDGIIRQNAVLMSGLFAGPVIGAASDLQNAVVLCWVFSLVTLISICFCRLLPKKIAFAVRIVLYALIAAAVYVPVIMTARLLFAVETVNGIGLYLTVTVANPLILSKTESRFFLRSPLQMLKDAFGFVLGFDLSCLLVGTLRDILTDNMLWNMRVQLPFQIPSMGRVYGGFILVGVLAGLCRAVYNRRRSSGSEKKEAKQ